MDKKQCIDILKNIRKKIEGGKTVAELKAYVDGQIEVLEALSDSDDCPSNNGWNSGIHVRGVDNSQSTAPTTAPKTAMPRFRGADMA